MRAAGVGGGEQDRDDDRGSGYAGEAASAAGGLHRRRRTAMRLLHQRLADDCGRAAEEESEGDRCRAARRPRGPQVPLRNARRNPARHQARANEPGVGWTMHRREFFKTSGALVVSFAAPSFDAIAQAAGKPPLVPGELDSWIAVL